VLHLKKLFETAIQSGALRDLSSRLQQGVRSVTLEGQWARPRLWRSPSRHGRAAAPAVLTAANGEARSLAQEIGFFLELLTPNPPRVIHLPSPEVDSLSRAVATPRGRLCARLGHVAIAAGRPGVLVASVRAASLRLHSPQRFLSYCLEITKDQSYDPELLREYLQEAGYVEDDPVTDPGEYSLRGGILDVYPPHLDNPARLEFFGDRIESLRLFDVGSQRSISAVPRSS